MNAGFSIQDPKGKRLSALAGRVGSSRTLSSHRDTSRDVRSIPLAATKREAVAGGAEAP